MLSKLVFQAPGVDPSQFEVVDQAEIASRSCPSSVRDEYLPQFSVYRPGRNSRYISRD